MANLYCTATNWGKDFFTHEDRNDFYLSGHPGDVWVVGNNAAGVSWINRVTGTGKTKAEAQAIVDGKVEEGQATWDALSAEEKLIRPGRPEKYILPQELTMANYKGIKGYKVQSLASDPTAADTEGQIWYNTAGAALKYSAAGAGAWASSTAVNTARRSMASAGTTTAALLAAGIDGPGSSWVEVWNGSTWTEVQNMITGRQYLKGAGTPSAFIACGGVHTDPVFDLTELYDGTSWTEVNNMLTARQSMGMASGGSTTASLIFGGSPVPTAALDITESWNGTSWTEVADLNTARLLLSGAGTSTAALGMGGRAPPPYSTSVESWNGTSWTEETGIDNARAEGGGGGTSTSALYWGGNPTPGVYTESWNGTAWTEVAIIANKAAGGGRAGTNNTNALAIAGYSGTANISTMEEWADPTYTVKTVTIS